MDKRGRASFSPSPPAARLFRSWECGGGPRGPPTARQAGAPGGEAVAFCSRSRETPGRPEFPPGAPGGRLGAGSIVAAALDGAGVLHGGLGPCSLPRPPPVPHLVHDSPAALGCGDQTGGGGGRAAFAALGLVSVPCPSSCPVSCVSDPVFRIRGLPVGRRLLLGSSSAPVPRGAGPAAPKAIPAAFPSATETSGFLSSRAPTGKHQDF